ncbi:MAG: hypothetical protein QG567_1438 [Campylobacterota bacterium]|nr:hypothetical protein [Campylobacterota bacterium]
MNIIKKIWSLVISMQVMMILVAIFAVASATGTFIENDHGRDTAWALIYGAFWFELLQILLGVNLIGNIIKYKIYGVKKLPSFLFHIGFFVILIGAGITRYYGYEGIMIIREGETQNMMLGSDAFMQITAQKDDKKFYKEKPIMISSIGGNSFSYSLDVDGETLKVTFKDFIKEAAQTAVEDENGKPIVVFAIPTEQGPEKYFINSNTVTHLGPFSIYLDKEPVQDGSYIHLYVKDGAIYIKSNTVLGVYNMMDKSQDMIMPSTERLFDARNIYLIDGIQLATKVVLLKGVKKVVTQEEYKKSLNMPMHTKMDDLSALVVGIEYKGEKKEIGLMGKGARYRGFGENFEIGDISVTLEWGSKIIELPFSLLLRDFILDKYAGSMSPSSYESHVTLIDEKNDIYKPFRIYMNNTLEHDGYKFFQSSYDKDERGTVLSVNHDPGKWPTYFGYFLLIAGMILNIFNPHSHLRKLVKTRYDRNSSLVIIGAVILSFGLFQPVQAYTTSSAQTEQFDLNKALEIVKSVDYDHAQNFGSILAQGNDGRIKPLDTINLDLLNKIHGSSTMFGLSHNQVILGMASKSTIWQQIDMIKVKHPKVKELLGIEKDENYFSFADAFDNFGRYKIGYEVEEALRKRDAQRGTYEKELLKIDEKLNVAYMIYTGKFMRVFPLKDDPNNTWYPPAEATQTFAQSEADIVRALLSKNFQGIVDGMNGGDWSLADQAVNEIKAFQQEKGKAIMPSSFAVELELAYNKYNIFQKLIYLYLFSGLTLLTLIFIRLAKPSLNIEPITKFILAIMILGFVAHTANLGMRWYISGHAPWSDAYESLVFIAWSIVLAGIVFAKQSEFAVSTTGVLAGLTLFVAHLSWIDPQITNLVPVLKSYWLTIHVCVITASYGFLGLSTLLGFISLILFIIVGQTKDENIKFQASISIKEATRINEISMIIGICLLTIGNFLGGVWANESWGRYWGWDPKETWTLVSILVYVFILHMRFVPSLKSTFAFSVASTVAYASIIMTYFGVNYYLSGLHSYASGDPIPVPQWIYYVIAVIGVVIAIAFVNKKEFSKQKIRTI